MRTSHFFAFRRMNLVEHGDNLDHGLYSFIFFVPLVIQTYKCRILNFHRVVQTIAKTIDMTMKTCSSMNIHVNKYCSITYVETQLTIF